MTPFFHAYAPILIVFILSVVLSLVIFGFSYLLAFQRPDVEKLSAYECGFDPYEDARNAFDVRFYIVAILFIIFAYIMIYWVAPYFNNESKESTTQSIPKK